MSILICDPVSGVPADSINYDLLRLVTEIIYKIPPQTFVRPILFRGSANPNFSWMLYRQPHATTRLYCSITGRENGREDKKFYELLICYKEISVYSHEWKNLYYVSNRVGHDFSRLKKEIDEFKIVLLDILQDISASMLNEFSITIDESAEYCSAQTWFRHANKEVKIHANDPF